MADQSLPGTDDPEYSLHWGGAFRYAGGMILWLQNYDPLGNMILSTLVAAGFGPPVACGVSLIANMKTPFPQPQPPWSHA